MIEHEDFRIIRREKIILFSKKNFIFLAVVIFLCMLFFVIGFIFGSEKFEEYVTGIELLEGEKKQQDKIYRYAHENGYLEELLHEFETRKKQAGLIEKYLANTDVEPDAIRMDFFYALQTTFKYGLSIYEVRDAIKEIDHGFVEPKNWPSPYFRHMGLYDKYTYISNDDTVPPLEFYFYINDTLLGFSVTLQSEIPNFREQLLSLFIRENGIPTIVDNGDCVIFKWIKYDYSLHNNKVAEFIPKERIRIDISEKKNTVVCKISYHYPGYTHNQGSIFGVVK